MWYYCYPEIEIVESLPYFLHSIGLHELQPPQVKPSGNHFDQFLYGTKGTGILKVEGKTYHIGENDAFFIPGGVAHEYYPEGDVWDLRWMVPRGDGLPRLYNLLNIHTGKYHIQDVPTLDTILNKMHYEIIESGNVGNLFASALVTEFITEFARQAGTFALEDPLKKENEYTKHFRMIENYVEYHFMTHIGMKELSELLNVTPQHVCRIIKAEADMRPMEYLAYFRMQKAKEYLRGSDRSIQEIALWCGFENENYFWKTFKKIVGMTPGEYRKKNS